MNEYFYSATQGNEFRVMTPYCQAFNKKAREIDGKFDANQKQWVFDIRNASLVKAAMLKIFGTTGELGEQKIDLRTVFEDEKSECLGPVSLCGRILAQARGRDSGATLGGGIVLESGSVTSGGSMKYWSTVIKEGTVLIARDFTVGQWAKIQNGKTTGVIISPVIPESIHINRDELAAERAAILKRIAEIDTLLSEEPNAAPTPEEPIPDLAQVEEAA